MIRVWFVSWFWCGHRTENIVYGQSSELLSVNSLSPPLSLYPPFPSSFSHRLSLVHRVFIVDLLVTLHVWRWLHEFSYLQLSSPWTKFTPSLPPPLSLSITLQLIMCLREREQQEGVRGNSEGEWEGTVRGMRGENIETERPVTLLRRNEKWDQERLGSVSDDNSSCSFHNLIVKLRSCATTLTLVCHWTRYQQCDRGRIHPEAVFNLRLPYAGVCMSTFTH